MGLGQAKVDPGIDGDAGHLGAGIGLATGGEAVRLRLFALAIISSLIRLMPDCKKGPFPIQLGGERD